MELSNGIIKEVLIETIYLIVGKFKETNKEWLVPLGLNSKVG